MEREIIKLSVNEQCAAVYGDSEEYDLIKSEITGTFKYGNENEAIVKRVSDGKFFKTSYRDSCEDTCGFKDLNSNGEFFEVFPKEVTTTIYE